MEFLGRPWFEKWMSDSKLRYIEESRTLTYRETEFLFRIPIGDYRLQLDYRFSSAIQLVATGNLLLCRKTLDWRFESRPLDAVLKAIGIVPGSGVLRFSDDDRQLAFSILYLTNRWGSCDDSIYLVSESCPNLLLFAPGSPESLFVICPTLSDHQRYVEHLRKKNIPAYGPYVDDPLDEPVYENIVIDSFGSGKSIVMVDPNTGKPIGPGSAESELLPEFLPPN